MTRGSRIIAIGGDTGQQAPDEAEAEAGVPLPDLAAEADAEAEAGYGEEPAAPMRSGWLAPLLAGLAVAGWTGFFAWARQDAILGGASPAAWADMVSAWAGPVLLAGIGWLLALRTSTREAARFNDAARLLSEESARLEQRLARVNGELSLAREFMAAQARDLEALGRIAAERLSQDADRLQGLIRHNGQQVEAIGSVSEVALDNMERLRGQLPVIASSSKDVTSNIANAGRAAHAQLQDLINGFRRLNEFGQASERQVASLRGQVGETLAEFTRQAEALASIATARFAAMTSRGEDFRAALERDEVEALAAVRTRADALAAELREARASLDEAEAQSLTSLRARLASVRDEGGQIGRAMEEAEARAITTWRSQLERMQADLDTALNTLAETDAKAMQAARARLAALVDEAERFETGLAERNRQFDAEAEQRRADAAARETEAIAGMEAAFAALDTQLAERAQRQADLAASFAKRAADVATGLEALDARLTDVAAHGDQAQQAVARSLATLAEKLAESRQLLEGTDREIATLTDSSVRLLELIQASVQHSQSDLPAALGSGEAALSAMEGRIFAMRDAVKDASAGSADLSAHVLATSEDLARAGGQLGDLHQSLSRHSESHRATLADLNRELESLAAKGDALSARARDDLTAAIASLTAAARQVAGDIATLSQDSVSAVAARLGEESGAAIEREMRNRTAELAGQLEQAAAHAAGVGREAAMQLRDQLAKVNELAGNLERRVAQARERAEDQVDNDFARRVALITDSLNSHAIDIAKALSADVSDTAWAAYLRGDRGIFTRRAVSLIDGAEARSISQLFEEDSEFRDQVSRYIHDFEAMLRQLLSTRDGHALGVTVLSSDMGKLYVALAQGIERLRA